jgi:tetratricopeptide (TPR) repeat protein
VATIALALGCVRALLLRARAGQLDPRGPAVAATTGLALFLFFLFPVSHAVDFGALMAERFLFAPSAGLLLAVGIGLDRLWERARGFSAPAALVLGVAGLAIAGGLRSHARAGEWRDGIALWSSAAEASPADARIWSTLGASHLARRDLALARRAFERAAALDPSDYGTRLNLAALLQTEGRLDEADAAYDRMIDSGAVDQHVWLNKARIEARRGRLAHGRELVIRAIETHPNYSPSHDTLAALEVGLARAEAIVARQRATPDADAGRAWLLQVAKACRALADAECERRFGKRANAVAEDSGG